MLSLSTAGIGQSEEEGEREWETEMSERTFLKASNAVKGGGLVSSELK